MGKGKTQICEAICHLFSPQPPHTREQKGKQRKVLSELQEEAIAALWLGPKHLTSLDHNCFICKMDSQGVMIQHWGLWLCAAPRHCPSNLIIRFAWERSSVCLHEGTNYKEGPLSFTSWKEAQLLISGVEQIIFGTRFLGPLGKGQRGEDSGQNMPSGFNFSCSLQ